MTSSVTWVCLQNRCTLCSLHYLKEHPESESHLPISELSGSHCMPYFTF